MASVWKKVMLNITTLYSFQMICVLQIQIQICFVVITTRATKRQDAGHLETLKKTKKLYINFVIIVCT